MFDEGLGSICTQARINTCGRSRGRTFAACEEPEVLYHFRKFTRISIPQDATRALSYSVLTDACARNPSAPLRWARRSQHSEHGQHYQHGQTVSRRLWSLPASVVRRGMLRKYMTLLRSRRDE